MKITTIGLDLAKNVFLVHGVNEHGVAVLRKQLKRNQVAPFFARLEPCLIGIEACGGRTIRRPSSQCLREGSRADRGCQQRTARFRLLIDRLLQHLKELDRQVRELEREIEVWHRGNEVSRRLETIPGIGPITASALVQRAPVRCMDRAGAASELQRRQDAAAGHQ
jgi:transposase